MNSHVLSRSFSYLPPQAVHIIWSAFGWLEQSGSGTVFRHIVCPHPRNTWVVIIFSFFSLHHFEHKFHCTSLRLWLVNCVWQGPNLCLLLIFFLCFISLTKTTHFTIIQTGFDNCCCWWCHLIHPSQEGKVNTVLAYYKITRWHKLFSIVASLLE